MFVRDIFSLYRVGCSLLFSFLKNKYVSARWCCTISAIEKFDKEQQENLASDQSVNPGMSPQAGSALSFLDACSRFDFLDEEEKQLLQSAINAIRLQKFANLQREINRIRKAQQTAPLKPPQLIDTVINVLKK